MSDTAGAALIPSTVTGNGMIAPRFSSHRHQEEVVIFASGVPDSRETCPEAFCRERQLVEETLIQLSGQLLVSFITTSVNDPSELNSPYTTN